METDIQQNKNDPNKTQAVEKILRNCITFKHSITSFYRIQLLKGHFQ